ncbi:hypothetical protein EAH72_05840 [Pseudomonas caspiana]|uniref:Uncharacterized protein n=1 Tax=Pseudomonas mandelii TaxID=75612 RepID=A0A502HXY1_9PSED|nr:hypothetical protein EAH74_27195 [Pseudomonas mandelii]TPG98422.1 hypothetical protein EAH72_05840 [Pseudomonas caspiana]
MWAAEELIIAGQSFSGFPILLWDSMESVVPFTTLQLSSSMPLLNVQIFSCEIDAGTSSA